MRSRIGLIVIAVSLTAGNIALYTGHARWIDTHARLTYVGLDSLDVVTRNATAARLTGERWQPSLDQARLIGQRMGGQKVPIWLVSLESQPTYGKFISIIRKLKSESRCNVVLLEHGSASRRYDAGTKRQFDVIEIPAFVLCGAAIGDAGFHGTLPPDV